MKRIVFLGVTDGSAACHRLSGGASTTSRGEACSPCALELFLYRFLFQLFGILV